MKITRRQLRRLINETMLQPTFFLNMKARQEFLPKIVADPNVHPKIKDLLKSGEESQTNQGVELLKSLNPEYIEELESYESHQDSIEYDREFEDQRDNLFFTRIKSIVDKYKYDMGIPLKSDILTVENISKDTAAGSYTDRSSGRRAKRFTHKRLHGAAIYATDKATLERIARELDSEKDMGGEQAYHGVGGAGQPLLPYINDYYLTALDSNLKYKNEMHKKGKYELKVFPATPDQRIYKQPTHRKLNVSMYETKIKRRQLRKLISEFLHENTNTQRYQNTPLRSRTVDSLIKDIEIAKKEFGKVKKQDGKHSLFDLAMTMLVTSDTSYSKGGGEGKMIINFGTSSSTPRKVVAQLVKYQDKNGKEFESIGVRDFKSNKDYELVDLNKSGPYIDILFGIDGLQTVFKDKGRYTKVYNHLYKEFERNNIEPKQFETPGEKFRREKEANFVKDKDYYLGKNPHKRPWYLKTGIPDGVTDLF